MTKLTEVKALKLCAKQWDYIVNEYTKGVPSFVDVDELKDDYTIDHEYTWVFDCVMCQYTIEKTVRYRIDDWRSDPNCALCPLRYFWGKPKKNYNGIEMYCLGEDSPYHALNEPEYQDEFTMAELAKSIADECRRLLVWWDELREMNQ